MWSRNLRTQYRKFTSQITNRYSKVARQEIACESVVRDVEKFKIGDKYHGFKVKNIQTIAEFRLCAYSLVHEATGAEYLHLFRNDSNNVFAVSFRTTPMDSTGAPHVLEHTVLCGSERFPVRDPFFKMLNRSLATFMNAMTGSDYTFYPFSTQNETDYRNLQKIYLDAVFRPNINQLDFMQEGWRLENADPRDIKSNIVLKGIVYNEMKGALAENEQIMCYKTLNTLLPDHTYGYVSGGDPFVIPELTWEQLKAFHRDHYHPSNSRIYSYGNFALLPTLEYVDKEYLSKYEKIDVKHTVVPAQTRWTEPQRVHVDCRFDSMGPPVDRQNSLAISLLMADIQNVYESFVLQFVTELLIHGPNSKFYKSLVEPKISGGFSPSTGFDSHTRDTIFTLGLQGLQKEQFEQVVRVFDETIDEICANGFEKEHIESVLHRSELCIKHQSSNFGLNLLFSLIPLWNHEGNLVKALKVNALIEQLKTNLTTDAKYLQQIVRKYFKENPHRLVVTMSPDLDYDKKYAAKESKLLKEKTKKLTEESRKEIYKKGLELLEQQSTKQNTHLLPSLQICDIKSDVQRENIAKMMCGPVATQVCRVNTNGVSYFRGILSTAELTPEQTMMLPLFCYVVHKLGTNRMNFLQFDSLVNRKTAGIEFAVHIGASLHQLHTHEPGVEITSYCLDENVTDMWQLWSELFALDDLKDVKRFEMLVQLYMANVTHGIVDCGHAYAMSAARGLVSGSSYQKDQLAGLQHITYMKSLVGTSNYQAILMELSKIGRILFDKNKLRCSINVSDDSAETVLKSYENFVQNLPGDANAAKEKNLYVTPSVWTPLDAVHCQHHVLNIPVYFCSKSVLTVPYVDPNYAKLRVLAKLLSAKYLHPELRERQGAYGGGATVTWDGVFTFYSYRDPRHLPTLDVFDESGKWLQQELKNITEQDVLEAKLGVFQAVDAPVAPCNRGGEEFTRGLTPDILQRHRAEIMSVDVQQLSEVSEKYLAGNKGDVLEGKVVLGAKNKELDVTQRKHELWTVMNAD